MKKFTQWSTLMVGIMAFALTGCNTMEGAGEDIESVGNSVQDAAD